MWCDRLAKDQPSEITMSQISEVQESPAFNGGRSFLALRDRRERQWMWWSLFKCDPVVSASYSQGISC